MTTSGVYGFVTRLEGDIAWLEIDDDVQIRIARAAMQRKVDTSRRRRRRRRATDVPSRGRKIEPTRRQHAADEPSKHDAQEAHLSR